VDDARWKGLKGGYRVPFDPRPLLSRLEGDASDEATWSELWGELYHQGDVGDASYAAVPVLVRIHRKHGIPEWNAYALVVMIDLVRGIGKNGQPPSWLKNEYFAALRDLADIGLSEISNAADPEAVRAILALLALVKGARTYARLLLNYSEDELLEMERGNV
jgi:hypothetical protein